MFEEEEGRHRVSVSSVYQILTHINHLAEKSSAKNEGAMLK